MNSVNITGNLTRDAELRYSQAGNAILSFSVAVPERRKNPSTGNWEDVPNYVDCCIFGNYATAMQKHLYKGCKVAVEGKLRYRSWQQDGQRRSKLEVVASEVTTMTAAEQQAQPAYSTPPGNGVPQGDHVMPQESLAMDVYDEDIPF